MRIVRKLKAKVTPFLVAFSMLIPLIPAQALAVEAQEAVYYVSPSGSDENGIGTIDQPFRTPHRARDAVRERIAGGMTEDVTVYLREGVYRLETPFSLGTEDSGRDGYVVTYSGYPGETAVLDGSRVIEGWQQHGGGIYKADIDLDWTFDTLYEDQERALKARHPNMVEGKNEYHRTTGYVGTAPNTMFGFGEGDIPAVERLEDLQAYIWPGGIQGYQYWASYLVGFESLDPENRIATLQSRVGYLLGIGSRYFVQGAIELLDAPGEFYLDREEGTLYYYPRDAAHLAEGIAAPVGGNLVEIIGDSPEHPAQQIQVENLVIRNSDFGMDGVHLENAERIVIRNNRIHNTGEHGVQLLGWARYNRVEGNEIRDVGYNGISLEGSAQTIVRMNGGNEILNNHVFRVGHFNGNSGGIRVYDSGENRVAYNRVHDIPRHAIHLKALRKGYLIGTTIEGVPVTEENYRDYQHTRNNIVEFNDLSHAMTDSQDGAVLASWGTGTGNILRNNAVHDSELEQFTVSQSHSFGYGIYLDDNSDDFIVEKNIVHNLQRNTTGLLHYPLMLKGIGIRAENNIVANNIDFRAGVGSTQTAGEISSQLHLNRNIYYELLNDLYGLNYWTDEKVAASDHNLFHTASGQYTFGSTIPAKTYDEWLELFRGKFDQHSLRTDPLFMDPDQRDYRLRYDSPAYRLGIEDINYQDIGLRADYPFADPADPIEAVWLRAEGDEANRSWIRLETGDTTQLNVMARTVRGYVADLSDAVVTYSSANPSSAIIDENGMIQAVGQGVAELTVTVTKDGTSATSRFHVLTDDALADIGVNAPGKLYLGESVAAEPYGISRFGATYALDGVDLTYSTNDASKAVVNTEGVVTGVGLGEFDLMVEASIDGTTYTHTAPMRIYEFDPLEGEFAGWRALSGSWEVEQEDGRVVYKSLTGTNSARSYLSTETMTDYTLSALVKVDEWSDLNNNRIGMMGRYVDPNTFYYAFYEESSKRFRIQKNVSGTVTNLVSSPQMNVDFVSDFRLLGFTLRGGSLILTLDGQQVAEATDHDIASGYAGLYTYNQTASYDDILVLDAKYAAVPEGWNLTYYGGKAAYAAAETDGTYALRASGSNVWGTADEMGFLYREVELPESGKVTITARLLGFDELNNSTMAGLMMRARDTADAANAFTRMIAQGNNQMTFRSLNGGTTAYFSMPDIGVPVELRLTREGDRFTSYYRTEGGAWIMLAERTVVDMPDSFLIGLGVSAHDATRYAEAIFSNVEIVVEGAAEDSIESFDPIEVDTLAETAPVMPDKAVARFASGAVAEVGVTWDAIDSVSYATAGVFDVGGTVAESDIRVSARVNVLPNPVSDVSDVVLAAAVEGVTIRWIDPEDVRLASIIVTGEAISEPIVVAKEVQFVDVEGLMPGTEYTFTVATVSTSGDVSPGVSVFGTTLAPTLSIAAVLEAVEGYVESGQLGGPAAVQVRNALSQAERHAEAGRLPQAVHQLENVVKHLNNNGLQAHIADDAKAELITKVQALIQDLAAA